MMCSVLLDTEALSGRPGVSDCGEDLSILVACSSIHRTLHKIWSTAYRGLER